MTEFEQVSPEHPRAESIRVRELLTEHVKTGIVAKAGLIAHGRGEAFDYLLGEKTVQSAMRAITAAAATLVRAERPVLSVNGNLAALCPGEIVELSKASGARIEVNLFHRVPGRESLIERLLKKFGADEVLGVGEDASARIDEVFSERRRVDPRGIFTADVVFVPLEDGDRTMALRRMGKKVITVDLNPLSRTSRFASITIVDNVVRAMPLLVSEVNRISSLEDEEVESIICGYNNGETLSQVIGLMEKNLRTQARIALLSSSPRSGKS